MTKKAKQYSATEKTKIVMETMKSEKTRAERSTHYQGLRWSNLSRLKIRNFEILQNIFSKMHLFWS